MNKGLKFLLISIIILLLAGMLFFSDFSYKIRVYWNCKKALKMEIAATVDSLYISKKRSFVILVGGEKLINLYTKENPGNVIEQGDSIYKPGGLFNYYVYKKGTDSVYVLSGNKECNIIQ